MLHSSLLTLLFSTAPLSGLFLDAPDKRQQAAKMFRESCMSCHVVPDLQFATDRAWLNQIKETA